MSAIMPERPAAGFDAQEIEVTITSHGNFGFLVLVNETERLSVTLPRPALERLRDRICQMLASSTPRSYPY